MVVDRFYCPVQEPGKFTFDACVSCKYFEASFGKTPSYRCRKNRDTSVKNGWLSAFLLHSIGREYNIEIIEEVKT